MRKMSEPGATGMLAATGQRDEGTGTQHVCTVFLDRDGVISRNRDDYVKSWDEFEFLPGALEALRRLTEGACRIVVVTNQSAVSKGIISRRTAEEIDLAMVQRVKQVGGRIDAVLFCPHRPDEGCDCRKPHPGLLLRAARWLSLDLANSFMVGDHVTDLQAGLAIGCMPVLVLTGRGSGVLEEAQASFGGCLTVAPDIMSAAQIILHNPFAD